MSTEPKKRPTIAELEAILNDPQGGKIEVLPDGSIVVDSELTALRDENARLKAEASTRISYFKTFMNAWRDVELAACRYRNAVHALGRIKDGKTLFESSPSKDGECYEAWVELNEAGKALGVLIDEPALTPEKALGTLEPVLESIAVDTKASVGSADSSLQALRTQLAQLTAEAEKLRGDGERTLSEVVLGLCYEIESYPPSEQQTVLSLAASTFLKAAQTYENTRPLTEHENQLIDAGWKAINATKTLEGTGSEHGQLAASGGRNAPITPALHPSARQADAAGQKGGG